MVSSTSQSSLLMLYLFVSGILLPNLGNSLPTYIQFIPRGIRSSSTRRQSFCGDNLATVIYLVCGGIYNTPASKKSYRNDLWWPDENDDEDYNLFLTEKDAMSLLKNSHQRRKRGVYEECCRKQCTTKEIKGYCLERK
ncbi:Uncharacterised protein g11096 [Pycnogonum litorale]